MHPRVSEIGNKQSATYEHNLLLGQLIVPRTSHPEPHLYTERNIRNPVQATLDSYFSIPCNRAKFGYKFSTCGQTSLFMSLAPNLKAARNHALRRGFTHMDTGQNRVSLVALDFDLYPQDPLKVYLIGIWDHPKNEPLIANQAIYLAL